jgi:BirA family biotin operon repressor/biotin-[acetyl-CoA-carboxylase] ligase
MCIEAHRVSGCDLAAVDADVAGTQFAGRITHLATVTSTNLIALEAAQRGDRNGVWVADEQAAGRGRGGHRWHSIVGDGLYVSALVTPALPITTALWISLATGLAAKGAIGEVTSLNVDLRWPNDLMVAGKKCGGILVETGVGLGQGNTAATLRYAVIGIGINLNHVQFPVELETMATSLRIASGMMVSREALLAALLKKLDVEIDRLSQNDDDAHNGRSLLERFAASSTWVRGKQVRVDEAGGYTGVTDGLDSRGFLTVAGDDGVRRVVLSGGVREA